MGVVIAVLVGLTATKTITEKRNEFFREAASGYNINAYYVAVNVVSTAEHSLQVIFSSMLALWLRNSVAAWYSYYINFLLLAWLCVSWALLFPLMFQPKSVVLVVGFYMVFFSLMFSGVNAPVKFGNIYGNTAVAIFSGLLSPARYFIEAMAVAESKCLPVGVDVQLPILTTFNGANSCISILLCVRSCRCKVDSPTWERRC